MNKYSHGHNLLSADKVRGESSDVQKEIMEEWFRKNFEDPANETPYMDGEYFFMHGGPYDAESVLRDEFENIVPGEVIDDFIKGLAGECWEWAPAPKGIFYEQGFSGLPLENFAESIENIKTLLSTEIYNVRQEAHRLFYNILYVNVITAVEAYLSDAFRQKIETDESARRRFVETAPQFQKHQITVSKIYKTMGDITGIADGVIARIIWHDLHKVQKVYKNTLSVVFPKKNTEEISCAIKIRHSIVHENESRLNGEDVIISRSTVEKLIAEAKIFVADIDKQIK